MLIESGDRLNWDFLYPAGSVLTLLAGFLCLPGARDGRSRRMRCIALSGLVLTLLGALGVLLGQPQRELLFVLAEPWGAVRFGLTPIGAFFVLVSCLVGIPVLLAIGQESSVDAVASRQQISLSLLLFSLISLPGLAQALPFFLVWELMGLSSFLLVLHQDDEVAVRRAGLFYLMAMQIGAFLILAGFLLVARQTGVAEFSSFSLGWNGCGVGACTGMLLLLAGFGCKAGLVPLHSWLILAHPAAPAPVSALMSAGMVNMGLYGLSLTLSWLVPLPGWLAALLLFWAIYTAVHGAALALTRQDLKELLAASTVENAGIITLGLVLATVAEAAEHDGVALLARAAALLHLLHHAVFKCLLFLSAGAVVHAARTRYLDRLGGLQKRMPRTAFVFFLSAMSAAAVPPGSAFFSEFLLILALLQALPLGLFPAGALFPCLALVGLGSAGVLALNAWLKAYATVFLGVARRELPVAVDPQGGEGSAFVFLLPLLFVTMLWPLAGLELLGLPLAGDAEAWARIVVGMKTLVGLLLLTLAAGAVLVVLRRLPARGAVRDVTRTWDCAYPAAGPRMQYSASSFVRSFLVYLRPLLWTTMREEVPERIFPQGGSFSSCSADPWTDRLIPVLVRLLEIFCRIMARLRVLSVQTVILQMLVFLVLLLVVSLLGSWWL